MKTNYPRDDSYNEQPPDRHILNSILLISASIIDTGFVSTNGNYDCVDNSRGLINKCINNWITEANNQILPLCVRSYIDHS
jgi:hypothetical protein